MSNRCLSNKGFCYLRLYVVLRYVGPFHYDMMTSSNGNISRVTGPLCGEFTGPGEFPTQRPVTRSLDVFFDLRLNKRLSKQPVGWWFETPSWSLWRQCNEKRPWYHNNTHQLAHLTKIRYQQHYNHFCLVLEFGRLKRSSTHLNSWQPMIEYNAESKLVIQVSYQS